MTPATGTWSFLLTDAAGNALADLSTATGRTITFTRNSYTELGFTISHQDSSCALLLAALANTGVPKLRAYRRSASTPGAQSATLRFRGYLAALSEVSAESSLLTATFRSPFAVLVGDGDSTGRFSLAGDAFAATDAGLIGKALIDEANANSPTGLATDPSRIVATTPRDRTYPVGQNLGQAIIDLSAVLDGFDFYETFVDGAGPTDAYFNVVPSLGAVQPNVQFAYGPQTLANLSSLSRTTTPPTNSIFLTGANGITSTYQDPDSVTKYGAWWGQGSYSTISDQPTLDAKAKGLCRPNPVKVISFVPEIGLANCPQPFDDWGLGDTGYLFASRSALYEKAQLRINGFTLPIDDNGLESVTVNDPTSPEDDAVLSASLTAEVLQTDGGYSPATS